MITEVFWGPFNNCFQCWLERRGRDILQGADFLPTADLPPEIKIMSGSGFIHDEWRLLQTRPAQGSVLIKIDTSRVSLVNDISKPLSSSLYIRYYHSASLL
jgi:hypothetical protein